jgi:hypothetical protein
MRFISIGRGCNVKYQINKCVEQKDTLLFDWIGTDMDTVNIILGCQDISIYFNENNIEKDKEYVNKQNSRVIIKQLPKCVSIHDLKSDYRKGDIVRFINKYIGRFEKMINLIRSNEKLYFVRYDQIEENQKNIFIETILKINPNCEFALISIIDEQDSNIINKSNRFLEFILMNKKIENDWSASHLDWKYIFDTIKKMI